MSWSINQSGTASAVKAALVEQFANARKYSIGNAHEIATIHAIERLVYDALDYLGATPVTVSGNGSAYEQLGEIQSLRSCNFSVKVEPIYGFVA